MARAGTWRGTGGCRPSSNAAEVAMDAGVDMVITNGERWRTLLHRQGEESAHGLPETLRVSAAARLMGLSGGRPQRPPNEEELP